VTFVSGEGKVLVLAENQAPGHEHDGESWSRRLTEAKVRVTVFPSSKRRRR